MIAAKPLFSLNLEEHAKERLTRVMQGVVKGSKEDVRTPFLQKLNPEDILNLFTEQVYDPNVQTLNGTLQGIEAKQKEKFGPRSLQKPWPERREQLLAHFNPEKSDLAGSQIEDLAKFGIPTLSQIFHGEGRLRPTQWPEVLRAMKRNTSAGLPSMLQKGELIDGGIQFNEETVDYPAVLFTRTQEQGKTRDVWGYPFMLLWMEGRYFLPMFNTVYSQCRYISALGGPDVVDESMTDLLLRKGDDEYVLCEDFESFDASVKGTLQRYAFDIIWNHFQGKEYDPDFSKIVDQFHSIGICTPDGIITGPHGVPSGSWFTNMIGSLVHLLAQCVVSEEHGLEMQPYRNQVMGDDGVIVLPNWLHKSNVADLYGDLGLSLNEDKCFESENEAVYLQRYYSTDYEIGGLLRGIYPVYRALNRLIHMERWTNVETIEGKDFFSIRAIAILENCKWHPMHRELVKWVWSNDKYSLEYSHTGLKRYMLKFQQKTVTTIRNQYSDYIDGIEGFETVKILKTL